MAKASISEKDLVRQFVINFVSLTNDDESLKSEERTRFTDKKVAAILQQENKDGVVIVMKKIFFG